MTTNTTPHPTDSRSEHLPHPKESLYCWRGAPWGCAPPGPVTADGQQVHRRGAQAGDSDECRSSGNSGCDGMAPHRARSRADRAGLDAEQTTRAQPVTSLQCP